MKFIIGIGNPGKTYEKTRHNIGFLVLDRLVRVGFDNKKVALVRPRTFVNRTGEAVRAILEKHTQSKPEDFLIVCDDANLLFGKMRLRANSGPGGHHGLESVAEALGGEGFARLRVGVGHPTMPKELAGFVLEKFSAEEEQTLEAMLERAVLVCESWVNEGFEAARNVLSRLQSVKRESFQ